MRRLNPAAATYSTMMLVIAASVGVTDLSWPGADVDVLNALTVGQPVAAQGVLFAKIEDAQVAEWTERFGGAEG